MMRLGVNIDHVATLRQARGTDYPDPVDAASRAEAAGADLITLHLREDRRHIQDHDVKILRQKLTTRMNLESAVTEEMLQFALEVKPDDVCLVPERREELTTEGGLNVVQHFARVKNAISCLTEAKIRVSLFLDPDVNQITAAKNAGAPVIEIHTGKYADAKISEERTRELEKIQSATKLGIKLGLVVNAGHGLNYDNVQPVAAIREIEELNIGHAIVARAIFVGWENAVREMKSLMLSARQ